MKAKVDVPKLFEMWIEGVHQHEICRQLGIRPGTFWMVRQRYALPKRCPARQVRGRETPPPTPEEIAERAAEVRAGWSEEETERRRVGRSVGPVRMRAYSFDRRGVAFSAVDY